MREVVMIDQGRRAIVLTMSERDDQDRIDPQAQAGADPEHLAALRRYVARNCRSAQDIDDIVQETYVRFQTWAADGHTARHLLAVLLTIARRILINRSKRPMLETQVELAFVDPAPSPEEAAIRDQRLALILEAGASLTTRQRRCVESWAVGLQPRDVAARLGITAKRASFMTRRALKKLKKEVDRG